MGRPSGDEYECMFRDVRNKDFEPLSFKKHKSKQNIKFSDFLNQKI